MMQDKSLVVLLLDRDGSASPLAHALRRGGHRLVTTTGLDTAVVVLGSLLPDVVVVRAGSREEDADHAVRARLASVSPSVPIRFIEVPEQLDEALDVPVVPGFN
jgi:hypothetical protein